MAASFFFYDLETSGFSPREARIMQFAGQRTDLALNPIGEPHNYHIKLTEDVLPDPDAVLLTGITPQQTLLEGMTEVEFLQLFYKDIATPDTIFLGYNTVRFDDEFMRYLHWRNFHDPYEWQWQNGRSRWDLLDVVRMTRALRPEGIQWPFDSEGKPTNRLELLTSLNGLDHDHAHDALSDVTATIGIARLIRTKQPKLFDYLLSVRHKKQVDDLLKAGQPVVYSSGKYPGEYHKTTVVAKLADHPRRQAALVYDLRHDPTEFFGLTPEQLVERWQWQKDPPMPRLPIKTMRFNCCPAVAPLAVLDSASQKRISLSLATIQSHLQKLQSNETFAPHVLQALALMDRQQQASLFADECGVDGQLYDGFLQEGDRTKSRLVSAASSSELSQLDVQFDDDRLNALLPLYKARNFPKLLDNDERRAWDTFRTQKLMAGGQDSRMAKFMKRLGELDERVGNNGERRYLLEELQLYAQSIMPTDEM